MEGWLKKAILLLVCLVPVAALAAGRGCGAQVAFRWVPKDADAPSSGSVHVVDARSSRTVQVLDGVTNHYGDDGGLFARDLDNDGCPDLVVTSDVAPIGNTSSTVYLYDRVRGRFVFNEALSAIGNISVDGRDPGCVMGDWKGGAEDVGGERYCWRKGRLVKTNDGGRATVYLLHGIYGSSRRTNTACGRCTTGKPARSRVTSTSTRRTRAAGNACAGTARSGSDAALLRD